MKFILTTLTAILVVFSASAQGTRLSGNVVNSATFEPIEGVVVSILGQNVTATTDSEGMFVFESVQPGEDVLSLTSAEIITRELAIVVRENQLNTIEDIRVIYTGGVENLAVIGVIDEALINDDMDDKSQDINTLVILSNDPYISNMSFRMSQFRFKFRNYDSRYSEKYINGINFNDQNRGEFNYAAVGALNDLTRNGDAVNNFVPGTFSFGNIGGSENINMRAGNYARGSKISASYTNSNYYLRAMISHNTGLLENGWAFSFGAGVRYSDQGYIAGTFYRNIAYSFGMEKQWNGGEHSLTFNTFGSPVERGQAQASFQEVYDLTGNNLYNPNWGYQNGKKRNARVLKSIDPTGILTHTWKINENTTLTNGFASHYKLYGRTALNWYKGADPRPDYYRNLPSWFAGEEEIYDRYTELWQNRDRTLTQIDWDGLYRQNQLNVIAGDGSSIYMVENRRSDVFETTFNSTINARINNRSTVTGGIEYRFTRAKEFKTVDDLMGGTYLLDIDKYSEQDFAGDTEVMQNDLNRPQRRVYKGDTFGYDYHLNTHSANAWFHNQYSLRNWEFYYGSKISYTTFQRDGQMRNGRFPGSSYGKGKKHEFINYAIKGGVTAKITGRHILTGNISYHTQNPIPNEAYVSPRVTDKTVDLENEKIFSVDLNYIFSLPSVSGRISVYQTNMYDRTKRTSYYNDSERTYVNHFMTGVNTITRGLEFGFKFRLDQNWSFDVAGTFSENYYSNNPDGVTNSENGKIADVYEKVYIENLYVGGAPQFAGTIGINYFWKYWFFSLNANGIARNYIDIAAIRRQASIYQIRPDYQGVNPNDPEEMRAFRNLTQQERFNDAITLDFSIGKILYLKNRNSMNFNFSLNNFLNKKNVITGGYEQGRVNIAYADRFLASKYYYMQGINCFLNVSYNF